MTLRMCTLMISRIHLTATDGVVWLFPASSGTATLVGIIHLTQPPRPCPPGGHALAAVFARVIWSLASEPNGPASAVAVLFPCCGRRVLEVTGVKGGALRLSYDGPGTPPLEAHTSLARQESIAAALLAHAQRLAGAPLN
jgi:hypothetical protein